MKPILYISNSDFIKVYSHIQIDTSRECGGFLLGSIREESTRLVANVKKVILINGHGSSGEFEFTSEELLQAISKALKSKLKLIGTYHSHGPHRAFLSETDKSFLKSKLGKEFMLILSPSHNNYMCFYKDMQYKIREADILIRTVQSIEDFITTEKLISKITEDTTAVDAQNKVPQRDGKDKNTKFEPLSTKAFLLTITLLLIFIALEIWIVR